MRKLIVSMMVSVDGYIEGKNPDYNWYTWDDEMARYMMDFFKTVDTFIYGRISYEAMIDYWPSMNDEFANVMNQTEKLIFSRTLQNVGWNSRLIRTNAVEEIRSLKKRDGKNMVLFAGADLAETFIKGKVVDEFRIILNPVVLGGGKPLFKNVEEIYKLRLRDTIRFTCGNIILIYEPSNTMTSL